MSFNPKVSVIIPVFNGSNFLREAIDSALAQTYKNIEIIVINDGSNDSNKTRDIAVSYGDKIKYFEKYNGGVATALNLGIEKMTGEYFSWLSHDDVYYNNKIEAQISFLSMLENKKAVIYSDFEIINQKSHYIETVKMPEIDSADFRYWITIENILHGCTLLIPKECFNMDGKFNESLLTTQDYDLWFRLAEHYHFLRIPETLVRSRQHGEQTTKKLSTTVVEECNLLLLRFYLALNITDKKKNEIVGNSFYRRRFFLASYFVYSDNFKDESWILIHRKVYYMIKKIKSLYGILKENRFLFKYIKGGINNNKNRFTLYYKLNTFKSKESRSGEGSTLHQTKIIREMIPEIFKKFNITTFIDAPCGDFNWMRYVNLDLIKKYYGIDIVDKIIISNKKKYEDEKKSFICMDIINDKLPEGDLILCRDCLVHLPYQDGINAIKNFKNSNIKYLLITTFISRKNNIDLDIKNIWRPLNMQVPPFNFPEPLFVINEGCTEDNNNYTDKCLALYNLKEINFV